MIIISMHWGRLNGQRKRAFTSLLFPSKSVGSKMFMDISALIQKARCVFLTLPLARRSLILYFDIYTIVDEVKFCIEQ